MHTICLPYHFDHEVDLMIQIVEHIARLGQPNTTFRFLLACSPEREVSQPLELAASKVAPTASIHCPTLRPGYPDGASAMFWDCLDWTAENADDGFMLWLESDMVPVDSNWLDRLDHHWRRVGDVTVMGCVVPTIEVPRGRRLNGRRKWTRIESHVNGGACYHANAANRLRTVRRDGAFDIEIGHYLRDRGGYAHTPAIRLSTTHHLANVVGCGGVSIVHGFLENKCDFVDAVARRCLNPNDPSATAAINPSTTASMPTANRHRSRSIARLHRDAMLRHYASSPARLTAYLQDIDFDERDHRGDTTIAKRCAA